MKNEIEEAASVHHINSILEKWAGKYDLDMTILVRAGIGVSSKKGIIETPIVGAKGSSKEFTGRDVYSVESTKDLLEIKDLVIKSIKYRGQ